MQAEVALAAAMLKPEQPNVYKPLPTDDQPTATKPFPILSVPYDETFTDRLSIVCSLPHFLALFSMLVVGSYITIKVHRENNRQLQDDNLSHRCAFVYLSTSNTSDVRNLGYSIQTLHKHFKPGMRYRILILHESIPPVVQGRLQSLTEAPLMFRPVHLAPPPDLNLSRETPTFTKRNRWSYQNMIRFWFLTALHADPSKAAPLGDIDYMVRMDTDAALAGRVPRDFVKEFVVSGAQYGHSGRGLDCGTNLTGGLRHLVESYVDSNGVRPRGVHLWHEMEKAGDECLPKFATSVEVVNMRFFRGHSGIQDWMRVVDGSGGIYRHRWGDAVLRFLTVAIYAAPEKVVHYSKEMLPVVHPHHMGAHK